MIDKEIEKYFETNHSIHRKILKGVTLDEILTHEWIIPYIELFITPPIIDQNLNKNLTNREHNH